jgi:hypothetical protein
LVFANDFADGFVGQRSARAGTAAAHGSVMPLSPYLRSLAIASLVLGATVPSRSSAIASKAAAKIASPDGKDVAEVRSRPLGGDAIYVSGARVWPKEATRSVIVTAAPRWSRESEAIALLVREQTAVRLVVVNVRGEIAGQVLEWDVPPAALPAKVVTWIDAHRVSVGAREMEPRMVATWDPPAPASAGL